MIVGTPTFYLKPNRSGNTALIMMALSLGRSDKLRMSTGEKISLTDWDKDRGWIIGKRCAVSQTVMRRYIAACQEAISAIKMDNSPITSAEIRWRMAKALNKRTPPAKSFTHYFEEYRNGIQNQTILTFAGKMYSDSYYKPITSTLNILRAYEQEMGSLSFESIDKEWYDKFVAWMYSKKYGINYVGINIKHVKSFIRWAYNCGITKSEAWRNNQLRRVEESSSAIYLSREEITRIHQTPIDEPNIAAVRDLFVLNCCLGLRFGDLATFVANINRHLVDTDRGTLVTISNEKTDEQVYIPLNPLAKSILDKYAKDMPKLASNQKFNSTIKEVCKRAGITRKIVVKTYAGGMVSRETRLKYELVTTHTARRSFATNLYLAKFPTIDIMKLTGHRTEGAFMRYIRAEALEVAYNLLDNDYFK